jgi:hypothetical protein
MWMRTEAVAEGRRRWLMLMEMLGWTGEVLMRYCGRFYIQTIYFLRGELVAMSRKRGDWMEYDIGELSVVACERGGGTRIVVANYLLVGIGRRCKV